MQIAELKLFQRLCEQEVTDGFRQGEISSRVAEIVDECRPVLNQVCRHFPEYTLHDQDHGFRTATNMGKIIPPATLARLNSIELSMLIYASCLHDIGMAATNAELAEWLPSKTGQDFIAASDRWTNLLQSAKARNDAMAQRRIEDMAFTDYLRLHHAQRGADFITTRLGSAGSSEHRIAIRQVNYAHLVSKIVASHWQDVHHLRGQDFRRDELVREHAVNMQYIAIILRLADLLDLDPERTPSVLLDFINPQDPTSAQEWAKHRSIQGWVINERTIRFQARCSHPAIQKGLREWMEYIDQEREECLLVVRDNREEIASKYELQLLEPVPTDTIQSDGTYIFGDFRFQLDYDRIVSLLMGTQLWKDSTVALRELLQNSIDTCRHRRAISERQAIPYEPKISLSTGREPDGSLTLVCEDNGMGMNEDIVHRYFMRLGRSYYQSHEFRQEHLAFEPISQFGLGIMSCFMLGDRIRVDTRHLSSDFQTLGKPLSIDIDGPKRYFVVREGSRNTPGTSIKIFVRQPDEYITKQKNFQLWAGLLVPHPPLRIDVGDRSGHSEPLTDEGYEIPMNAHALGWARSERPDLMLKNIRRFDFQVDRESTKGIHGTVAMMFPVDTYGRLVWSRGQYGDETLNVSSWGGIEYRKWGMMSGRSRVTDRGVIENTPGGHRWSQDGIWVRGSFPVGAYYNADIPLPVPCYFNVDLQGQWKVHLDVTRTDYVVDDTLKNFRQLLYGLLAGQLRQVLQQEQMLPITTTSKDFIDELLRRCTPDLRTQLKGQLNL